MSTWCDRLLLERKRENLVSSLLAEYRIQREHNETIDRERCKILIYIRDHFERWSRVRIFMVN